MQYEISKGTRDEIEAQTIVLQKKISELVIKDETGAIAAKALEKECKALENFIEERRDELVRPLNETVKQVNAMAKDLVAPITLEKENIRQKQIAYANEIEKIRLAKEAKVFETISQVNKITDELDLEIFESTQEINDKRIEVAIVNRREFFAEQKRQEEFKKQQLEEQERLNKIKQEQGIEAARLEKIAAEKRLSQQAANDEAERIRQDVAKKDLERQADEDEKKRSKETSGVKGIRTVVMFEVTDEKEVPREYLSVDETKVRAALKEGKREIAGLRIWGEQKIA